MNSGVAEVTGQASIHTCFFPVQPDNSPARIILRAIKFLSDYFYGKLKSDFETFGVYISP